MQPDWFKKNLGTGDREVIPAEAEDAPKELNDEDEPQN